MVSPIRLTTLVCALACLAACTQLRQPATETAQAEAARIEAALAEIEQRALLDPDLRSMDQSLGEELIAAMSLADPGLRAAVAKLPLLHDQRARAIQAADAAAAAEAARRIAAIERRYVRARTAALRNAGLAGRVDRFNALLRRRMAETDDSAEALLRRYAELQPLLGR
ncbi:MAG TPA: hypothetical protein VHG93_18100 [Longimicrobium sp.]|nr:hypothetical protein [Longimicrobium sp.]